MGIDVDPNRVVTLNANHAHGVDTEALAPRHVKAAGRDVACVFGRNEPRHGGQDGNPLIYALKRSNGYTIGQQDLAALWSRVPPLIPLCHPGTAFDYVIPVPSSSKVVADLVQHAVGSLQPAQGVFSQLRKATVGEARAMLAAAMPTVAARDIGDARSLERRLAKAPQGGRFTLKEVEARLRAAFKPVTFQAGCSRIDGASVLIVDDLLSTGCSISSACHAAEALGAASIKCLVLLG